MSKNILQCDKCGCKYSSILPECPFCFLKDMDMSEAAIEKNWENDADDISFTKRLMEMKKVKEPEPQDLIFDEKGKYQHHIAADCLKEQHIFINLLPGEDLLYYSENEGIYKDQAEALINQTLEKWYPEITTHQKKETIAHVRHSSYFSRDKINKEPTLLHVKNGILNLKTGELGEFSPEIVSLSNLDVEFTPETDCPGIRKFISEIVDGDDVSVIQEMIGYCLYKMYPLHKAFMLIGEGANGKSTLIELIKRFLGPENVASVSLQGLIYNRFASARLYNKMANLFADLSDKSLTHTGMFKLLTGGDTISAERKFKDGFEFMNYAKLIFSANKLPQTSDDSKVFFRRWIFLNFPNEFMGEGANPNLINEICTDKEMSGLLNWALEGLKRLLENGQFSDSKSVDEVQEQYVRLSNSLAAFCMDCVEQQAGNSITKEDFYNAYAGYCRKFNLPIKAKNLVGRELNEIMPVTAGKKGKERAWIGIRLLRDDSNAGTDQVELEIEEEEIA